MTFDFLIGAIRASRDLHPLVKTELEEILNRQEPAEVSKITVHDSILERDLVYDVCECGHILYPKKSYCPGCGRRVENVSGECLPVITCKDCANWHINCLPSCGRHGCDIMGDFTGPDDYCKKAVLRT